MGAAIGGARKSSRGRRGVPRYGAMADINMTPFIDVMLVLLIIFMVAAPLLTSGVSVDLPQAKASALNVDQKPIAVSLNEQGQLFLMDQPIADADLTAKLQELSGGSTDQRIYVARLEGRALRPRRPDHGRGDRGRLQEGRSGHRARQQALGGAWRERRSRRKRASALPPPCMRRCWRSSFSASRSRRSSRTPASRSRSRR